MRDGQDFLIEDTPGPHSPALTLTEPLTEASGRSTCILLGQHAPGQGWSGIVMFPAGQGYECQLKVVHQ
jgi:hypothetical protein